MDNSMASLTKKNHVVNIAVEKSIYVSKAISGRNHLILKIRIKPGCSVNVWEYFRKKTKKRPS